MKEWSGVTAGVLLSVALSVATGCSGSDEKSSHAQIPSDDKTCSLVNNSAPNFTQEVAVSGYPEPSPDPVEDPFKGMVYKLRDAGDKHYYRIAPPPLPNIVNTTDNSVERGNTDDKTHLEQSEGAVDVNGVLGVNIANGRCTIYASKITSR